MGADPQVTDPAQRPHGNLDGFLTTAGCSTPRKEGLVLFIITAGVGNEPMPFDWICWAGDLTTCFLESFYCISPQAAHSFFNIFNANFFVKFQGGNPAKQRRSDGSVL